MTPHDVRYSGDSATDVAEHRTYYREIRPELDEEFARELDAVIDRICLQPELHAFAHRDLRRARLRRFPFAATYRFEDGVVEIVVRHARQARARGVAIPRLIRRPPAGDGYCRHTGVHEDLPPSTRAFDSHPVFDPDGRTTYFRSNRRGTWNIWKCRLSDAAMAKLGVER